MSTYDDETPRLRVRLETVQSLEKTSRAIWRGIVFGMDSQETLYSVELCLPAQDDQYFRSQTFWSESIRAGLFSFLTVHRRKSEAVSRAGLSSIIGNVASDFSAPLTMDEALAFLKKEYEGFSKAYDVVTKQDYCAPATREARLFLQEGVDALNGILSQVSRNSSDHEQTLEDHIREAWAIYLDDLVKQDRKKKDELEECARIKKKFGEFESQYEVGDGWLVQVDVYEFTPDPVFYFVANSQLLEEWERLKLVDVNDPDFIAARQGVVLVWDGEKRVHPENLSLPEPGA